MVSQRLLPRMDGQGQVACFEILLATSSVRNMIRDDKTFLLGAAMQMGKTQGNRTADMAMQELVQKRLLSPEDAYIRAKEKSLFENMVGADFLAEIQRRRWAERRQRGSVPDDHRPPKPNRPLLQMMVERGPPICTSA